MSNLFLARNKAEWLSDTVIFKWTEEDLNEADEDGKFGSKYGIDCYLSKPIDIYPTESDITRT